MKVCDYLSWNLWNSSTRRVETTRISKVPCLIGTETMCTELYYARMPCTWCWLNLVSAADDGANAMRPSTKEDSSSKSLLSKVFAKPKAAAPDSPAKPEATGKRRHPSPAKSAASPAKAAAAVQRATPSPGRSRGGEPAKQGKTTVRRGKTTVCAGGGGYQTWNKLFSLFSKPFANLDQTY